MPRLPVKGDHSQRITIPLPHNYQDLEATAKNAFGGAGRMRMYQKGETEIQNQQQFRMLHDNDVVVVTKELFEQMRASGAFGLTTNQAMYVEHPIEPRKPLGKPPGRRETCPTKFHGTTCYAGDYIEHPLSSPDKVKPAVPAWQPANLPMTARSAYAENFPWHSPQPKRPDSRPPASKYSGSPAPFQGNSSYKIDYVKHDTQRPQSAGGRRKVDKGLENPARFDGTTTYTVDFKNHPRDRNRREALAPSPRRHYSGPSAKFEGTSEYKVEYTKKQRPRGAYLHLEPEAARGSRPSTPM